MKDELESLMVNKGDIDILKVFFLKALLYWHFNHLMWYTNMYVA